MPNIGELVGRMVDILGEVLGSSSLRLGIGPTAPPDSERGQAGNV